MLVIERVRLADLVPHPENPRRGDVAAVADSLSRYGQFKPLTVHRATRQILTGNHTWMAAQQLGWSEIDVAWFDGDEQAARRVVISDNRSSDLASYEEDRLTDLLASLPDLTGTGYDDDDLLARLGRENEEAGGGGREGNEQPLQSAVRLGPIVFTVEPDAFAAWRADLGEDAKAARKEVKHRLAFPKFTKPRRKPTPLPDESPQKGAHEVVSRLVADLKPLPQTVREGDVGAIAESLSVNGQYRPIVVTPDGMVVLGWHVALAAQALGWTHLAAVEIDVDLDTATRISLIDNRTSDLGGYDDDALVAMLRSLGDLDGTGFDLDDLDDLLNGGPAKPGPRPRVSCLIGDLRFSIDRVPFNGWLNSLSVPHVLAVADRLRIAYDDCDFVQED